MCAPAALSPPNFRSHLASATIRLTQGGRCSGIQWKGSNQGRALTVGNCCKIQAVSTTETGGDVEEAESLDRLLLQGRIRMNVVVSRMLKASRSYPKKYH